MNSSSSSNFTNFTNFTTITNWSAATNQSSPLPNTPSGGVNVPTKDLPKGCLAPYKPKLLTREQIVNRIQKQQQREGAAEGADPTLALDVRQCGVGGHGTLPADIGAVRVARR